MNTYKLITEAQRTIALAALRAAKAEAEEAAVELGLKEAEGTQMPEEVVALRHLFAEVTEAELRFRAINARLSTSGWAPARVAMQMEKARKGLPPVSPYEMAALEAAEMEWEELPVLAARATANAAEMVRHCRQQLELAEAALAAATAFERTL